MSEHKAEERWQRQEYVNGWLVGLDQNSSSPPEVGPWWFSQEYDAQRLQDYLNALQQQVADLKADRERAGIPDSWYEADMSIEGDANNRICGHQPTCETIWQHVNVVTATKQKLIDDLEAERDSWMVHALTPHTSANLSVKLAKTEAERDRYREALTVADHCRCTWYVAFTKDAIEKAVIGNIAADCPQHGKGDDMYDLNALTPDATTPQEEQR